MTIRSFILLTLGIFLGIVQGTLPVAAETQRSFLALCYHNIEDSDANQAYDSTTTAKFIEQMAWLKHEGYTAVTLDDLIAARSGKKPLPEKAVLLTFDDGYESFYTRAYPILKAFHFPSVIALVDAWMEDVPGQNGNVGDHRVSYGDTYISRSFFLTWPQVKEMVDSGLVEVASHSDALHMGVIANPQGNTEPAETTLLYDKKTGRYESDAAYRERLKNDAEKSAKTIEVKLGHRPRAMVWPYGSYNGIGLSVEREAGMPITLSLDNGMASIDNLRGISRQLIDHDPEISDYVINIRQVTYERPIRVVQVDLDYVYDPDPVQLEHNLDLLVGRIHDLQINTVFLQAFADPQGTGFARQLYFPNRVLPMRANLFNRVTWQLKTRANVDVYGWLPVSSFDLGNKASQVLAWDPNSNTVGPDPKAYHRVSIFDPAGREQILEIYEDMARSSPIDGLLFHDDAVLSDYEDASAPALAAYQQAGLPASLQAIHADARLMSKWTTLKAHALTDFTKVLTEKVKMYRQPLKTVRNIYAAALLEPESEEWLGQNYDNFLASYDYTAVEAMPEMENINSSEAESWMQRLVVAASRRPKGLSKTIFELQAVDWRKQANGDDRTIPVEELGQEMRFLTRQGALNFGYYPDDFVTNTPAVEILHKDFSLQTYPYQP